MAPRILIRRGLGAILVAAAIAIVMMVYVQYSSLSLRLPGSGYLSLHDRLGDWQSYGGTWEIRNGAVHNDSDERGAKLVAGRTGWSDYTLETDLKFDGDHGDMGIIIRSNNEEEGVDAYDGYYVGLRTTDGTLVAGRSDYGWMEARPVAMPGGIHAGDWYRLTVSAVDCRIAASSENLSTGQKAWLAVTDEPCVRKGRIGLRSLATGGTWKNIRVSRATNTRYLNLAAHAAGVERPEFPRTEAEYNRFFRFSSLGTPRTPLIAVADPTVESISHISDLQNLPRTHLTPVRIRGIVTLTGPRLYVQDASGGVLIDAVSVPKLNVGDAVEVQGSAQPTLYSAVIKGASVHPLWSGTPVPPTSVTPAQAALGTYDGRFIEVAGRLLSARQDEAGREVLELEDNAQPFRAIYPGPQGRFFENLKKDSYLSVRGICVLDKAYTRDSLPFALLLRSDDDIQVLAGPHWWTPLHVGLVFVGALALALMAQVAYFRVQRWKTLTITQERERLAHEIHDTMAQSFAGVGYQIQGIRSSVVKGDCRDFNQLADQLKSAYLLVRRCHEDASRTIAMLGSSPGGPQGDILQRLKQTAESIAGKQVRTVVESSGTALPLNLRVADALLHIGQEAIANALQHANPTAIRIRLSFEGNSVQLVIADDGHGFEYKPAKAGFGIPGMQKRARSVGAKIAIESSAASGTEVRVFAGLQRASSWRRLVTRAASIFRQ